MPEQISVKIKENDISKFRYKDVLGNIESPEIVIVSYSPSSASYSYCLLSDFPKIPLNIGYSIDSHSMVKNQNKWVLIQEYGYHWGRITNN